MKPRWLVLALLAWTLCAPAEVQGAIEDSGTEIAEGLSLRNAELSLELRSRGKRLSVSSSTSDTTWVGYTPSAVSASNWWGVYAGFGKDGYYRPMNGAPHKGVWDFETPVHGDSLQGWWPLINLYASSGGQTRTDRNRPWWALDFGNMANYVINQANGRTFGVVGVWHRDGGSLAPAPGSLPSPEWAPAQGNFAAWMGLRAHGDETFADAKTGNPFNEDVLIYTSFGAISAGGNDQGFPGYGSQMDQMLYRDLDLTGSPGQSITVRFKFRTVMSTGAGTTASTRTGWFDSDPLGVTSGVNNPQPNNFISSSDAGDVLAPKDSFMVYVGQSADDQSWLPAAANFGQNFPPRGVYDPQRRWFGEILRWDRDPGSPTTNPQPLYYRELLSVAGVWPARADTANPGYVDTTFTISSAALQPLLRNGRARLVFRSKTNRGFDDQGSSFSSNQRGAVVVDRVSYRIGAGSDVVFGDFENASDIDNDPVVSPVAAWKSTGKPPGILHHTHVFADLVYEDLCGQKGDVARQCNMSGVVISAGDHDNGEAVGGLVDGTAQREINDGIMSPTIQLCGPFTGPGGTNAHGLKAAGSGPGDVDPSQDYYLWYDVYTAIFDPFTKGNLWRYACMSYPGNSKDPDGAGPQLPYPAWGQMRFVPGIIFNPDPQCLIDFEPLIQGGLVKTSNTTGIPDSMKVFIGKTQQCFRFGVSAGCSPTDGGYWDNLSLAIIDDVPAQLSVDIWMWLHDAFPANESPGLPGTAAFDTTAAHVKNGLNLVQSSNNNLRFAVPGDSAVVNSSGNTARVDMVFRILPGPGNYEPVGRPDLGTIVKRPDNRAIVTKGDGSFWDAYRQSPGDFASLNAVALHHNAIGGWDPNVWNSARCDTAEANLFARHTGNGSGNVLGGPPDPTVWMSTLHESDPHFATLGIVHNRCFVSSAGGLPTDIVCNGTVPSYIANRPEHADVTGTTKESTKIIPDGLLTPGSHVEYFFRDQKGSAAPGPMDGMCPDTNLVIQIAEGSTDGHRWQEFGVLPNAWKKVTYRHPITSTFGLGPACMLVIDANDRRGNERVWVGIADTINATPKRYWGAHNGWHAVGNGDLDNPADNRRPDGQPGFVSEHVGQAGSGGAWDMYQVKASESLSTNAGSIGSRRANRTGGAGQQLVIDKSSRIGPTPEMLNAYYTMILYLSGDLNSGVLGPYRNKSQNDAGILMEWLSAGNSATQNRGFWAIGDGFAESNIFGEKIITTNLMLDYLGTDLIHWNYTQYSSNTDDLALYRLLPAWQNKGPQQVQLFGIRNLCLWTNDVLTPGGIGLPSLAVATSEYDRRSSPGGSYIAPAGVFKDWDPTSPWKSQVEGWDLEHLTATNDASTLDRAGYFYKVLINVWAKLCTVAQSCPCGPCFEPGNLMEAFQPNCIDVPAEQVLVDFARLGNNPLMAGTATVYLGLAKADRVEAKVFDVSGRLVRTLADRRFPAGKHELVWNGSDDAGRQVPRGVYFTQVKYRASGFEIHRKLTVLK